MIREATVDDLGELLRMARAFHIAANYRRISTYEESEPYWEEWLTKCVQSDSAICLISEDAGKAVGFGTAFVSPVFFSPTRASAQGGVMWVDPEYRRTGRAGEMLDAFVEWAKRKGACIASVTSTVHSNPKVAGKMYRKHGFRTDGRIYHRRTL